MQIETLDRRRLSEPDARAVATLLCQIWPKPDRTVDSLTRDLLNKHRDYAGPEARFPRLFIIRQGDDVIACAGADPVTIGTSAGDMTVLALSRVCTDPEARGLKLGQAVVRAAFELVDDGTYPYSLFQTSEAVRPFYEKLGCVTVDNRFVNSTANDPNANPFWDTAIMRYPDTPGWPAGQIDLRRPGW
ncbi:MAG TPA: GNAT family N-acetyltransferase [Pirellulales bacterium]|nr:GNAT family N-acetyltransferase [Pirellulales bacterium]